MPDLTHPRLPDWLPPAVRLYLDHTEDGCSFRALAKREGRHASTIMRQVRRYENRRDDPLLDEALNAFSRMFEATKADPAKKDTPPMSALMRHTETTVDEQALDREGRRILRRLAEPGAVMAIAPEMEKAVVLREFPDGRNMRTGVLDRAVAQAFTLKDWIACRKAGRVSTYEITASGRAALKRMIDDEDRRRHGMAEASASFADQHRTWGERSIVEEGVRRRVRYNLAESPIGVLGRRRDKDGKPFLPRELVAAGERLREDFELAASGPRMTQDWDHILTGAIDRSAPTAGLPRRGGGAGAARDRVAAALSDLGPGLADVALRCCCYLEGLETLERRMGWSARSGKIVLRIALQRLQRHYEETGGRFGPLIG